MAQKTFSYAGISFRQNPKSPELFAFVAPADDLVTFCGVARKSPDLLTNYQRALDPDRVNKEVMPFFKIPENCSPTAIVISLHETPVAKVEFTDLVDQDGLNIKKLTLALNDPAELSVDEVLSSAKQLLDKRLESEAAVIDADDETLNSEDQVEDDESQVEVDVQTGAELADETDELEQGQVEIGRSMLKELRIKLDQKDQLTGELIDTLRDMLKPALIIDGQHRTFGAAKLEEQLLLSRHTAAV